MGTELQQKLSWDSDQEMEARDSKYIKYSYRKCLQTTAVVFEVLGSSQHY